MRNNIRKKTGIIIHRPGEYLVGRIIYSSDLRWSIYPGDAWITRDKEAARRVADKVGGELMLFNPIVRQIRKLND